MSERTDSSLKRLLTFDFDGVLVDSIDEAALTAYNAVTSQSLISLHHLPDGFLDRFRNWRFVVQPAGDFIPFTKWCLGLSRADIATETTLDSETLRGLAAQEILPLRERTRLFFETRKRTVKLDRAQWLSLHRAYQPIFDTLKSLPSKEIYIITNKNRSAVCELLEHFGASIPPEQIYSGDGGATKQESFTALLKQEQRPLSFIDDSIENLLELKPLFPQIQMLLARWGYQGPQSSMLAEQHGIPALTQDEAIKLVSCDAGR